MQSDVTESTTVNAADVTAPTFSNEGVNACRLFFIHYFAKEIDGLDLEHVLRELSGKWGVDKETVRMLVTDLVSNNPYVSVFPRTFKVILEGGLLKTILISTYCE